MCELWLIRHAQTLWNAEKRIQGQSDTPLSPMGIAQAELLRNRLRGVAFDQIYSSDTERAHHTARLVFGGREILLEPRLREMSYGTLEGKTRTELVGEEREAFLKYWHDPFETRTPGGESWRDLDRRVVTWLKTLPKEGRVAALSHGGTIRSALFYVTGTPKKRAWDARFGNTGITRLRLGERPILLSQNDTAHLEGSALEDDGES
jgi:broad specificity phosphatase PhoE